MNNVISSRIRLARNFKDLPFSPRMKAENKEFLTEKIHQKVKEDNRYNLNYIDMSKVTPIQAGAMVEEHLISLEFANNRQGNALLLSDDKKISAMIGEEDHLRLQLFSDSADIKELWEKASEIDDWFDSLMPYAFSEELGYLTACPTNLGTGLRASVMLHLPALTESGYIERFISAFSKIGLTVRGMYGEGTAPNGAIYQLSNQITMGISEEDTVERLIQAVEKITQSEKEISEELLKKEQLKDRIARAEGILRYSTLMSSAEFIKLFSDVRWSAEQGLNGLDPKSLDDLFLKVQPYNIMLFGGEELNGHERDRKRADILRRELKQL
jgi:protein arginine kinase